MSDLASLIERVEQKAARNLGDALDDNPRNTGSRLAAAQMAAALYTCAAALKARQS